MKANMHMRPNTSQGFTLIEVMITVAIVGIIAAIALPSYQNQVRTGRRSDAIAALSQIQQAQERWRANNASYTTSLTGAWPGTGLGLSSTSSGGYYTLAITAAAANSYTLTASGTGSQTSDTGCTTLTVTVTNGTSAETPANCWKK